MTKTFVGYISIHAPGQYFVEPPLAAITAASLLGYVTVSFAQLDPRSFSQSSHLDPHRFSQSSWQNCSRLDGDWMEDGVVHRFSFGLRPGF